MKQALFRLNQHLIAYEAMAPCADTSELADAGPRLMFRHGSPGNPESQVFIAPKGMATAGWVLGVVDPTPIAVENYSLNNVVSDYCHNSGRGIIPESREYRANAGNLVYPISVFYNTKDGHKVAFDYDVRSHSWILSAD